MSVYLGQDKVGVAYLKQANMYAFENLSIMNNDLYTSWTRPEGWPDLDSLNLEMSGTDSFIYMTFRTGHVDDIFNCGWTLVSGQSLSIEIGNIINGEFVLSYGPYTQSSNGTLSIPLISDTGFEEGYIVIKVTGRFSKFYLKDYTRSAAMGGGTIKYYMQPVLERIWYVPEMTHFYDGSSNSTTGNGAYTLQRDKINNNTGNALTNLAKAWWGCYNLQSLDISGLDTHNVTSMSEVFSNCEKLENLDISHFNTAKVTSISYMFYNCFRLKELDLRNWNTEKLTGGGITYTFYACYALKNILGLKNIYTNNLTSLANVFYSCRSLEDLSDVSDWNTSKVTNFSGVFGYCHKIKHLNLNSWDITKATTIQGMFNNCRNLEHIIFPSGQTSTLSGSQSSIFYWCQNLQEVDLTWIKPITSAVTSIGYMFYYCRSLSEINIPEGWDVTGCVASEACLRTFSNCYKVQRITGISNWDMSGYNYTMANSFENDYCLKELDISNWCAHPTTMYYAFFNCYSLKEIDLTGWHWENMTGTALASTFGGCYSLKSLKGIEHMGDSGNITSFGSTFSDCWSLTSIPNINSWNPAKVTTIGYMFQNCYSLRSLTITNWSLPKCTTMNYVFRYCYNLQELDLTGWSVPAVTNTDYIFCQLYQLQKFSGLPLAISFRMQDNNMLPEDQWARVFTQLPTVSNKTINMTTAIINKLTSTTKAIATNKGWTLSN